MYSVDEILDLLPGGFGFQFDHQACRAISCAVRQLSQVRLNLRCAFKG